MKTTTYIRKVKKIDFIHAKQYLERNGWRVIQFNIPSGDEIIQEFGLESVVAKTDGFVYDIGWVKYVFINSKMSERDKLIVLLHETGHIVLEQDLSQKDNKLNGLDAWKFAADVYYFREIWIKRIIAAIVCVALTQTANYTILNTREATNDNYMYVTPSGTKYHTADCYYIKDSKCFRVDESEAAKKYQPCSICIGDK